MAPLHIGIVGGGPSGLMTAHALQSQSHRPVRLSLYEASHRLGGKVLTRQFAAAPVAYEAGAAELYDYSQLGPDPLRDLVAELGLPTSPMTGETVILDGRLIATDRDFRRAFGSAALAALRRFRKWARKAIAPSEYYESDWKADNDDPLSRRSFRALLAGIDEPMARRYVEVALHSDVAAEPHRTSAMYGLQNWLMNEPDYMRLYRIDGGNERLTQELARRSTARQFLGHRATRIERTPQDRYRIWSASESGPRVDEYDAVVVALPNNWLPAIDWGGARLDRAMARHHAHYDHPAHYLRVSALFRTPFWRPRVEGSYFMSDAFNGCCIYDESPATGAYGVLGWLLAGEAATTLANAPDDEVIRTVLARFPTVLGDPTPHLLEARVHRWVGAVNALPGGRPMQHPDARHRPEPVDHPLLFTVGDYLFDSTLNGALDSAELVAEAILNPTLPVAVPTLCVGNR